MHPRKLILLERLMVSYLFINNCLALLKDYYLAKLECPAGGSGIYWCTSTNWAFAKLPEAPSDSEVLTTMR